MQLAEQSKMELKPLRVIVISSKTEPSVLHKYRIKSYAETPTQRGTFTAAVISCVIDCNLVHSCKLKLLF